MMVNRISAQILHLETREVLGRVSLVGAPIPGDDLVSSSGSLQGFLIEIDKGRIWQFWLDQQNVLMKTEFNEYIVKVVTYPTERDNLGYLDFIRKVEKSEAELLQAESKQRDRKKGGFFRSLLGF